MKYWWINQSATYKTAISAGFIWSPKFSRNGRAHRSSKFIVELAVGDILFSNHLGGISAIGRVDGLPRPARRPYDQLSEGDGWLVPVTFIEISNRIHPKKYFEELAPFIGDSGYPLTKNGFVTQMYLSPISSEFADVLIQYIGVEFYDVIETLQKKERENIFEIGDFSSSPPATKINVSSASGIFPYLPQQGKFHILTGENGTGKTRYLEKISSDVLHALTIGLTSYSSMMCFSGTIYDKFPKQQKPEALQSYLYFGNKTNNNMFSEISPFRQLSSHLFSLKPDYAKRNKLAGEIFQSIGLAPRMELILTSLAKNESVDSELPISLRTQIAFDGRYPRSGIPDNYVFSFV